jgi:hypothetical protein
MNCNNLFIEYRVTISRETELSEPPEKKVLKQALGRLKSNALTSENTYNAYIKNFNDSLRSFMEGFAKLLSETKGQEEKQRIGVFMLLLSNFGQAASHLLVRSLETLNVWKTYTETLENYSSELDSTLTNMFQDAVKQFEEQIKKQKELIGKTPEYTR